MVDINKTPEELQESFVNAAMQAILAAGDARHAAEESFEALISGDEDRADMLMKKARNCILEAHRTQTEIIQTEATIEMQTGKPSAIPLLFIHAQDTVMTVMSEVNLYKAVSRTFKAVSKMIGAPGE